MSLVLPAMTPTTGDRRYWYNIQPFVNGAFAPVNLNTNTDFGGEFSYPYTSFVSEGETRPLYITHALIQIIGVQKEGCDEAGIVIESPSGSLKWKDLVRAHSVANGGMAQAEFTAPGVMMVPGDDLCIAMAWLKYTEPGLSHMWNTLTNGAPTPTYNRLWVAAIHYTIGLP